MPPKMRTRAFRREQMPRDRQKRKGPRTPKREAYAANKRVAEKASLREMRWNW